MSLLLRSFFRGLLFVVPIGFTVWVLVTVFFWIDELIPGIDETGLGFALTIALITAAGFFASLFLTRWVVKLIDRFFKRMPIAKLIYGAIKDLLEAFVGEHKKFDRPVVVSLGPQVGGEIVGFITSDDLEWLGRKGSVAVYFPQSYNFAGSLAIFPSERVTPVEAEPSSVMQFIVSGGVSRGGG